MVSIRQEALNRDVMWKGFVGLLLLPLILATCAKQIVVPIVDRGETVSVPRDMRHSLPFAFDYDQDDPRIVVSLPMESETYLGKIRVAKEELIEGIRNREQGRPANERIVYLKAGVAVSYGNIIEVLKAIRTAGIDRVGLVVRNEKAFDSGSKEGFLEVKLPFEFDSKKGSAKIDQLMILISIDADGNLKFNDSNMGTISDTVKLVSWLSGILRQRSEWNREGAAPFATVPGVETERTVFIKAADSIRYENIARLTDLITGTGAKPICLQLDESLPTRIPPPPDYGHKLRSPL